jgi:hypothetical protein
MACQIKRKASLNSSTPSSDLSVQPDTSTPGSEHELAWLTRICFCLAMGFTSVHLVNQEMVSSGSTNAATVETQLKTQLGITSNLLNYDFKASTSTANTNAAALAGAITQSDPPDTSSPGAEHIRQRGQFPL